MVCGKQSKEIDLPGFPLSMHFDHVAKHQGWQTTMMEQKLFICCPDCIGKAYDTCRGSLGFLKTKYKRFMVKDQ